MCGIKTISQYILDNIPNYRECVMVAKHPSSTRRVSSYAERLRVNFAVIHGELKEEEEVSIVREEDMWREEGGWEGSGDERDCFYHF